MTLPPSLLTRRHVLWMIGAAASGVALHGCANSVKTSNGTPDSAATGKRVSVKTGGSPWIGYTPVLVAIEKGFFLEGGLELDYQIFSGSSEPDAAFAAGKLQGLNNPTSEAVSLITRGKDFRIIQVADTSLGGDGILARNSITDISDFKGKKVGVDLGGVSHFFLLQVLEEAGLNEADIELTNLPAEAAAAAYQAGRIDVAVTFSPFLKQTNEAQSDGRIIYDTSKMPTAIVDVYMFDAEFVQQQPDAAQAYVNGIFKAREFFETNKDEALEICSKWLDLDPETIETELQGVSLVSPKDNVTMLGDPISDRYLLQHMMDLGAFLAAQGQISQAPSEAMVERVLDPTFVKAYG